MRGFVATAMLAAAMLGFPGLGVAMADCGAKHAVAAKASASADPIVLPTTSKTKTGGG